MDIETAPNLSWVWGRWEQNVIDVHTSWFLLSFAYKWQGERKVTVKALPDYPRYKRDKEDDKDLVKALWAILDACDVAIAHNGDAFDFKRARALFVRHKLKVPSPFKTIDTLKIARNLFGKTDSNALDDLGGVLGCGRKIHHTGKHLWFGCMKGEARSWNQMRRYNAQDVTLLERVYNRLKPFAPNHPNLNVYTGRHDCPSCQSPNIVKRGFSYARSLVYQRYQCKDCGSWHAGERIK